MKDFKKPGKFSSGGGFNRSSGGRPSYGPPRGPRQFGGRDDGPKEMFEASCNKCGKACEVPFRPNGKKPVYCRDCFVREDGNEGRDSRNSFVKKDFAPKREFDRPQPPRHEDHGTGMRDVSRQLESVNDKLEKLIRLMENSVKPAPVAAHVAPAAAPMTLAKAVTKATAPKPAPKAKAPAKKAAAKTPAKAKTAKKK